MGFGIQGLLLSGGASVSTLSHSDMIVSSGNLQCGVLHSISEHLLCHSLLSANEMKCIFMEALGLPIT